MKKILALLLAAACVFTLCACGKTAEKGTVTVRLNEVTHSVFYAPQYLAIEKGFFADEGLAVELTNGGGADKVMEKRRSAAEQFDLSAFLPFWDELAGAQKAALSNRPVGAFSDGEKILLPLAERTGFLLVLKGALRVYISSEGGREFTLYKVPAGGMCSILPIDGAGMPNIVADGPTAVVHITTAIILQILAYLPAVSDYYLACMVRWP